MWRNFSFFMGKYLGLKLLGHVKFMFNFMESSQTVSQSGCTILHSQQQCIKVPVALHPHLYLVYSTRRRTWLFVLLFSHSNSREVVSCWGLICISLVTNDVEVFSDIYLSHMYLCQQSFFSNLLPIFKLDFRFLGHATWLAGS